MTDPSAINLPVQTALTSQMNYGLLPSCPKSRSYRINVAPINKSIFSPGDSVIIELPTGRKGTYFDQSQSYLKFSVQCSTTTSCLVGGSGIYWDNSAYSAIQRLDVYNSSNLLETINEYGQLCNLLIDTSLTQSDKAGLSSMIGTNFTPTVVQSSATYSQYAMNSVLASAGDRSGQSLASVATASGISTAIPYTYCLPLLSGIVGVNASKMLPVGALSNPVRLELYLANSVDDMFYYGSAGAGLTIQIINVEFCACYVELYDDIEQDQFRNGIPQFISTSTYRQASTYLPSSTSGEFTTLLPFRGASINALYARFRPYAQATQGANATASYRKGASVNPNLSSFYYRVANSLIPNKPVYLCVGNIVGNGAEAYAELLKSFHSISSSIGNTAISYNQYNVCSTATNMNGWAINYTPASKASGGQSQLDTSNNAFCLGLELQTFANRNDTILSGISTLNSQIFFTGTIQSGKTAGGDNNLNYTVDFFSSMDMILVIENGIMSAKF